MWVWVSAACWMLACGSESTPGVGVDIIPEPPGEDVSVLDVAPTPDTPTDGTVSPDLVKNVDVPVDPPPAVPLDVVADCSTALAAIYDTPPNLPAMSPVRRGELVACALEEELTADSVTGRLKAAGIHDVPATGVTIYRISYRTERHGLIDPEPYTLGTAWAFVPEVPRAGERPVVIAAHGTVGLADSCAPSKWAFVADGLPLPWAAAGYVTVAPDYAGMGTVGTQGYGDARDTGYSTLDSGRAIRHLFAEDALSDKVVVLGHSQGGGAALSAHALDQEYEGPGEVVAVVPFAPGLVVKLSSTNLKFPLFGTGFAGGVPAAVFALQLYAYHANTVGLASAGDGYPALFRQALVNQVESQCIFGLAAAVPAVAPVFGNIIDESLRLTVIDCMDGLPCVEPGKAYYEYLVASIAAPHPDVAPNVFLVQGSNDAVVNPKAAACIRDSLQSVGIVADMCVDGPANHFDVVVRNAATAIDWVGAVIDGTERPTCENTTPLPPCE